jgi:tripartite-type tricarboxylate transporter receptor subunit TctC
MNRREAIPALTALLYGMTHANAQTANPYSDFPKQNLTLLCGFPPGGLTDVMSRKFAQFLQTSRNAKVVVENKPGASGQIASSQLTKSKPDGYTLMCATTHHVINPAVNSKLPYNTKRDFTNIAELGAAPNVLLVSNDVPANNLQEFLDYARKSGNLAFASTSVGGSTHMSGELLALFTKAPLFHVPYKGAAPMMTDLLGGQVKCAFNDIAGASPFIRDKRCKAIGITSQERLVSMPDIPTFVEQGLKEFVVTTFWGIYGPAGMPPALVEQINRLAVECSTSQDMVNYWAQNGGWTSKKSVAEYNNFINSEIDRWARVAKERNIVVE